jgi:DNA-binding transcriptional regulator YhcF (GntR family)
MQEKLNAQDSQRAYVRVIDYIKQEIRLGHLSIGSRLPPERTLAETLNVSRNSVREALHILEVMGITVSTQGAGHFIAGNFETSLAETMSIPLQQMARVCHDGAAMAEEDLELLRTITEPEEFAKTYRSEISDPVKVLLRDSSNYDEIQKNPFPYLKLWLRMGLRHPGSYLKAWVDQTKGYWNGGYAYWITARGVYENELGLMTRPENIAGTLFYKLMRYMELMPVMHPLLSIGLHTWLAAICCLINRLRSRKEWLLSLPWLVILLGLLIGTPVFAEFRYAYPVMLACPLILTATFLKQPE